MSLPAGECQTMRAAPSHSRLPSHDSQLTFNWLTAKLLLVLASTVILGSEPHGTHVWRLWEPSVSCSSKLKLLSSSQSQSYFTTGGLPPISSSWRQAHWDSRPDIIFQLNRCCLCSSHEKICLSLMNMLGLSSSVRIAHIACYWKIFLLVKVKLFPFALYTNPLSIQAL
jgi:hypothetical protein